MSAYVKMLPPTLLVTELGRTAVLRARNLAYCAEQQRRVNAPNMLLNEVVCQGRMLQNVS